VRKLSVREKDTYERKSRHNKPTQQQLSHIHRLLPQIDIHDNDKRTEV